MDERLQELENELKRLRPRDLSPDLLHRLEGELGPVPAARRYSAATNWRSWKWAGWSLAGVAAAAALMLVAVARRQVSPSLAAMPAQSVTASVPPAGPAPAAVRYQPVRASSVLYEMKDDGVTTLPDRTEGRQVRYRYVDTYTWKNPQTNASLRWSVPREEVRLIRASLN